MGHVRNFTHSKGQNWENKDLTLRVTFPSLAYLCSYSLDPLTFHMDGHVLRIPSPSPFLPWHVASYTIDPL